ncbi:MAG: hypothetical protein KF900_14035 [Bacteroidetes bacterium]|nr:hypothetical protein [Bacteroidota bacterium]
MQHKLKITKQLCAALAAERTKKAKYKVHDGFKAYAFYLLLRSKYKHQKGLYFHGDSTHRFCYNIGLDLNLHPSTVQKYFDLAVQFGFMRKAKYGYEFRAMTNILIDYAIFYPTTQTITLDDEKDKLQYILKTLVVSENFNRQTEMVCKKIRSNPARKAKLATFIPQWETMPVADLLHTIVQMQQRSFANGSDYDFWHSIHADITLSLKGITKNFAYSEKSRSAQHLKQMLSRHNYIAVGKRKIEGDTTRKPHDEQTGECKPITMIWLPKQHKRAWLMPDELIINPRFHNMQQHTFAAYNAKVLLLTAA